MGGRRMNADEQMEAMDAAAFLARQELDGLAKADITQVQAWFRKWYLKAGYKRLCKVLMAKEFTTNIIER